MMSTAPATPVTESLCVRGARTHNLRNIDVDIPLGRLVVMSGVSGSGKSSLAIDTVFAEGQRRYLECVSVRTQALLRQFGRPDVDDISGLPPTVCVDQRFGAASPRSLLANTTEIHDFLRVLYARAGLVHCPSCGREVRSQSVDQIVERVLQWPERTRLLVMAPLVRERRGRHRDVIERIMRFGFVRARIDGSVTDVSEAPELAATKSHTIEAVVDRLIVRDSVRQRLRESLELACREGEGTCVISRETDGHWVDEFHSTRFCCADCDLSFPTPEPRLLNHQSGFGACPTCEGAGYRGEVDEQSAWTQFRARPCPDCHGTRLQPLARRITFFTKSLPEFLSQPVGEALGLVRDWQQQIADADLPSARRLVAEKTLPEMERRLDALCKNGLHYLTLDRTTRSLSGGEYQRARLAACLGAGLHGACYVLDEPTTGLHPRDTRQLLDVLDVLRDSGATVIVVEHDPDVVRAADWLIDLGPGAGADGGSVVFTGSPEDCRDCESSLTGRFLAASSRVAVCESGDRPAVAGEKSRQLQIRNARRNNLRNVTVDVPLNRLVSVTGVSGCGKSSLVMQTLLPVAAAASGRERVMEAVLQDVECEAIDGLDAVRRVIAADTLRSSGNRRSCAATVSGLWSDVRRLFAKTRDARMRGFTAARFSFNSGTGRCPHCLGTGQKRLKMRLLPDASVPCPACDGSRFAASTLQVRYRGLSPADVLRLRIDKALDVFSDIEPIRRVLAAFHSIGLGYLTLGQPASTWSSGETQRVRLAAELSAPETTPTLFILDEPTAGLHPADTARLIGVLRSLRDAGHSVVAVEHNLDLIAASDHIIDLGPEAGADGGQLIHSGPPQSLLSPTTPGHTAAALRQAARS